MTTHDRDAPTLTFAVPVRNGARYLPRLLDSLRAQTRADFEVVVSDNVSDDETEDIVRAYADGDSRVRYCRNEGDIGQIANFNRSAELSRGRYVRWIGCDDWLEPTYTARCVEVLERAPDAVGVTTFQDHVEDDGTRHYAEFTGERLESPRADVRIRRMLWFFRADYRFIDPLYAVLRRDVLLRTGLLRFVPDMDQLLALQLVAAGPFLHVPACLAHRRRETITHRTAWTRYHPQHDSMLRERRLFTATLPAMWRVIDGAGIGLSGRAACALALGRMAFITSYNLLRPRVRGGARAVLERTSPTLLERVRRARRANATGTLERSAASAEPVLDRPAGAPAPALRRGEQARGAGLAETGR